MDVMTRMLRWRSAWLFVVLGFALTIVHTAVAEPPVRTVVYVGSAQDDPLTSDVVAVLDAEHALDGFEFTLTYDPAIVTPKSVRLEAAWTASPTRGEAGPGKLTIAGVPSGAGCAKGTSCRLASVSWAALSAGTSQVELTALTLKDQGNEISQVNRVIGQVRAEAPTGAMPAGGGATPPPLPGSVNTDPQGVITGVPQASGEAAAQGIPSESGVGFDFVLMLVAIVLIAVVALVGALLIIALARRSWHWSAKRPRPAEAGQQQRSAVSEIAPAARVGPVLEAAVSGYFEKVEAFGMVAGSASADHFLLDVAVSLPTVDIGDTTHADDAAVQNILAPDTNRMVDRIHMQDGPDR